MQVVACPSYAHDTFAHARSFVSDITAPRNSCCYGHVFYTHDTFAQTQPDTTYSALLKNLPHNELTERIQRWYEATSHDINTYEKTQHESRLYDSKKYQQFLERAFAEYWERASNDTVLTQLRTEQVKVHMAGFVDTSASELQLAQSLSQVTICSPHCKINMNVCCVWVQCPQGA